MEAEAVIGSQWGEIAPVLSDVRKVTEFTLSLPCVVTSPDSTAQRLPLSGLASALKASPALSSPVMEEFQRLSAEVGAEEAFEVLANGESGEEFCNRWDEAQAEIGGGAKASISDVVEAIGIAREGFLSSPKKLLVVVMQSGKVEVTLVK